MLTAMPLVGSSSWYQIFRFTVRELRMIGMAGAKWQLTICMTSFGCNP